MMDNHMMPGMPMKKPGMNGKMGMRDKVASAFHEVKENPPKVLAKTRKKSGAAQANKQKVAIALSKARQAGAKIPYANINRG